MKPKCKLIGEDGNIFNLLAIVHRTLRANGMEKEWQECQSRVYKAQSYDEALFIIQEYVEVY